MLAAVLARPQAGPPPLLRPLHQLGPHRVAHLAVDAQRVGLHCRIVPDLMVNTERPDRAEPHVLKRRKKQYPYVTKSRTELRKRLNKRKDAA